MTRSLNGAVALVTGAAGGIGQAACRALEDAGARVVATDLAYETPHDVTDESAWRRVIDGIEQRFGRLDCLVNNAGMSLVDKLEDMTLETWRRCQSVNVDSMFLGMKTALPLLRRSGAARPGGASVVNLSSVAGLRGAAFNTAYCTSKGAVRLLTKAAAVEFSTLGYPVRVNSVHPGGVRTDMMGGIIQRYVDLGAMTSVADGQAAVRAMHPAGRMAEPEEIAAGIVFLCSEDASYMQGSELVIDGGYSSR